MEKENENLDSSNENTDEQNLDTAVGEELDAVALKAKLKETEDTNKQLFERAKKAEAKLLKEKVEKKVEEKVEEKLEEKKGELDETQLDYLDLKGITDSDEIELIHNVMKRTGQTVRQALKDDYVQTKLNALRKDNELKDATPGSTRRSSGGPIDTTDYWLARFEQKGELPKDFKLRSEVINRKLEKENTNKPAWHH